MKQETTATKIGYVIVIILGLLAIILIVPQIVAHGQNVVSFQTMQNFERYRTSTLQRLSSHLEIEHDCIYKDAVPLLEKVGFGFAERKKSIKAWVDQKKESVRPVIWFNSRLEWTEEDADSAMKHEILHLLKTKDGEFFCGPDRFIRKVGESKIPVCRPFGEEVYDSEQLTEAILKHFAKVTLAKKD